MQQASNLTKDPINMFRSQNISQQICNAFIDLEHTHTLNKFNQFYIFKNKLKQFSKHILTHVFLVMAKSHCTYSCIKSSKRICVLCVKI